MKQKIHLLAGAGALTGMLIIILDSKLALSAVRTGMAQCAQTVIPALFPFFFLSSLLTNWLSGVHSAFLRPIGKLCGIPCGAESILLLGLIGGYPIGAKSIMQSFSDGSIDQKDAQRMLGFCSNAGPAFIFGMVSSVFNQWYMPWLIWGIHIASALVSGILLPGKNHHAVTLPAVSPAPVGELLHRSITAMASVCGWVILFRLLLDFMNRWFLWLFPIAVRVLITGIMELTNGFISLKEVADDQLRMLICSGILSWGGLCVLMQTASLTGKIGIRSYVKGKILQTSVSLCLTALACSVLYGNQSVKLTPILLLINFAIGILICHNNSGNCNTLGV